MRMHMHMHMHCTCTCTVHAAVRLEIAARLRLEIAAIYIYWRSRRDYEITRLRDYGVVSRPLSACAGKGGEDPLKGG